MQQGRRGTDASQGTAAHTQPAPSRGRGRRQVSPLTVLGVLLLTAGFVCLGWVGWQYFGTNIVSQREAESSITALEDTWAQPAVTGEDPTPAPPQTETPAPPPPIAEADMGSAQWLLRIPALGDDWVWPVVAGVSDDDLRKGVGWYPTTAQPGQVGNFALAGHRVTNGEPFRRLLDLRVGDEVVIETRDSVLTYELTSAPGQLTVQDTETWVLDPVPGHEGVQPTESLITLTTCEDLFHSPDRSVAFGVLTSTEAK
ncbi:MAG: class E sortase [Arachnia sp.]